MPYRFMRFPEGKTKAVTFSYDDGVRSDVRLAEICDKYGLKATFNICSTLIASGEGESRLSENDMKKLISHGHEIAVHGDEHKSPARCTDMEIIKEFLTCREILEDKLGEVITGMAYPDLPISTASEERYREIRVILKSLGISYSRTLGNDNNGFALPDDWLAWMPTIHHDNENSIEYARQFVDLKVDDLYVSRHNPRLFYVWGHSYEFDNNNNWEHFEELCKILSGKDDTWYATNIEICRYSKAFDSLVFNTANTCVYNPTAFDIWFACKGKTHCVKAGETLNY
ncbi:MAG: polysaccharide deacetylase family protein [Clostridia bacterium]|nr:polysaccharide deacetylase family protein [Clostridia bacterium]